MRSWGQLVEEGDNVAGAGVHEEVEGVENLPAARGGAVEHAHLVLHGHRHDLVGELREERGEAQQEGLPARGTRSPSLSRRRTMAASAARSRVSCTVRIGDSISDSRDTCAASRWLSARVTNGEYALRRRCCNVQRLRMYHAARSEKETLARASAATGLHGHDQASYISGRMQVT